MIVGPELRSWLEDPAAQRRTRSAIEAFARSWSDGRHHRSLADALARLDAGDADGAAAVVCEIFENHRLAEGLVEGLAESLRSDPFFVPPFVHLNSSIHSGLILYEDDLVSIAVGTTDIVRLAAKKRERRDRASIIFSGQVEVFKFVRSGAARLAFWHAPPVRADFAGDRAGRCAPAGTRRIEDGDIVLVDGRRESFVIEHAAANLVLLQATLKAGRAPVSVEYDAASHEYVGCSAADDSASRIQMIATLLRKLDHGAAVPVMVGFLDHPSFFVRWHVMRELLGLDAAAALPHLERMASRDPHPEVRRAARAVLDRIEASASGRRAAA